MEINVAKNVFWLYTGYWENAPLPVIALPLAPPSRQCSFDDIE